MLHSLSVSTRPSLDQAQIQRIYQADLIAVDPLADIAERRTQDYFNSSAQTKPEPVFRNALISQMEIWSKNQSDLANEEERR